MRYNASHISHAVTGLILDITFHTEDPYGVEDTVKFFLFPDLFLSASSKATLVARRWYTTLDSSMLTTYANTVSILQRQKFSPIVVWKATKSMLYQWAIFFAVLWRPPPKHRAVYELMLMIYAVEEINSRIWAQARCQLTISTALV